MGRGHVDLRDVAAGALARLRRRLRAALDHRESEEDPQRTSVVDVPRDVHVRLRRRDAGHRPFAPGPACLDRPLSRPATSMKSALGPSARSADIPATMLAVVFSAQDQVTLREVPTPRPGPREVLVRVRSSMICASDAKILAGKFPATKFPHVPGHEFAGEIAMSGDGRFAVGARVGVEVHVGCGTCDRCREGMYTLCQNYGKRETGHAHVGFTIGGGLAEYAAVPIAALHILPEHVSFDQGAWTDNLGVALWALERGRIGGGEHVVVIGPGAIGLCAAQLARALGAGRVTLVGRGDRFGGGGATTRERRSRCGVRWYGGRRARCDLVGPPRRTRGPRWGDRHWGRAFRRRSLDQRARQPRRPGLAREPKGSLRSRARVARRRQGRCHQPDHTSLSAPLVRRGLADLHRAAGRRDPRDAASGGGRVMDNATALELYRVMRTIRGLEERATQLFGENKKIGRP